MDRITEVTRECFNAVVQVRQLDDASLPPAQVLHQRLCGFVDAMFRRAAQEGLSREDASDAAYAIVALADEVLLAKSEEVRQYWIPNLLQLHYFRENVAGEAFFERLEGIRRDPRRAEVLRVYYLALVFGFQGRYRVRGGELELLTLTDALARELGRGRRLDGETLSPSGERPSGAASRAARGGPLLWASLGAIGLAVVLYLGLRVTAASGASTVADRIAAIHVP